MLHASIEKVMAGTDLSRREAAAAMGEVMDGKAESARIAAFLTALRIKGETVPEIVGCAQAMRERVVRVRAPEGVVLDTCGTGGDGSGTFNISTISAFVVAAAGVTVAKHGNRAASSRCGSSDILLELGANLDVPAKRLEKLLRTVGIAYMHAPNHHPAMKYAGPVRRELGFRTIFNLLGPLSNPAFADTQVIGVFDPELLEPYARVLKALKSRSAFVVHGAGGLDEFSTLGPNRVVGLKRGKISRFSILPGSVGLQRAKAKDLRGGDPSTNARIVRSILKGRKGPKRDAVTFNAGMALVAAKKAKRPRDGVRLAGELIDSGAARRKLEEYVAGSQGAK